MRKSLQEKTARISRRAFLGKGGLVLGGLGVLGGLATSDFVGAAQAPPRPAPKPIDLLPWKELRASISGGVLRPGEAGYAKTAAPWNLRYSDRLPGGIALCRSPQDVMAAFSWAESVSLPVAVRGGGHSAGGYSSTRGLQLDLSSLDSVAYDPETTLLTVGGGARFSKLREVLEPHGRAVPMPRFEKLGIGGTALGGGLTLDMRRRGLVCDQLQEMQLVTPRGDLWTCNRETHFDTFWAARGAGGGQLGALTSLVLKTFEVEDLAVFRMVWESDLEDLFPTLLTLLPEGPESLGAELVLTARHGREARLELIGQFSGPHDELRNLLDAAFQIATPKEEQIETLSFWEAKALLARVAPPVYQAERTRYAYSEFALEACDKILENLRVWPGTSGEARWSAHLTGKSVDNVGRRNTAYVHRGARYLTMAGVTWSKNDAESRVQASLSWLDSLHAEMERYTSGESSQNWPDPALEDYATAYFGENLSFLAGQRREVDPERVLQFEQTVRGSSEILTSS